MKEVLIFCLSLVSLVNSTPVLLIYLDGFRWDYFEISGLKAIPKILERGVKAESMLTVFPSDTYPNFYASMTGLWPENSGMVGNHMYDPVTNETFEIGTNKEQFHSHWWDSGEPIWVTAEKQGKKVYMYHQFGCEVEIRKTRPTFCDPYNITQALSVNDSRDSLYQSLDDLKNGKADLAMVYFEHIDHIGHYYGAFSQKLNDTVREVDGILDVMLDKLESKGMIDNINLVLFSDHGHYHIGPAVPVINFTNYFDESDVFMFRARSIWPAEGKTMKIYNAIKDIPHLHVYLKEETPERWHFRNNRKIAPIVYTHDIGYQVRVHGQKMWYWKEDGKEGYALGTHGLDPKVKEMETMFMAFGPAFKKKAVIPTFQNIHMYELLCYLLNIHPAPNDGSLNGVIGGLINGNSRVAEYNICTLVGIIFLTILMNFTFE